MSFMEKLKEIIEWMIVYDVAAAAFGLVVLLIALAIEAARVKRGSKRDGKRKR